MYQFTHTTSGPLFLPAMDRQKGQLRQLNIYWRKHVTLSLHYLSYRVTLLSWCRKSPAELLMGSKICSTLPQTTDSLVPQWPYLQEFRHANKVFKEKQKANYDCHHSVHDLLAIPDHTDIWVTTGGHHTTGRTVSMANTHGHTLYRLQVVRFEGIEDSWTLSLLLQRLQPRQQETTAQSWYAIRLEPLLSHSTDW